jgi:4-amino-4-deoxy-L-arabinose transferase-like glycosyltransferase
MPEARNILASMVMSGSGTRPNVLPCAAVVRSFRPAYRLGSWLGRLLGEDRLVARIALVFALSELVTLAWDLPGSHGWDNDGAAPRDFFGGIANNLAPGRAHRYPLFHYLVLAVPSLPILVVTALAGPLTADAIRERMLSVPAMTTVSIVAKLVAAAMAALAVVVLARLVRRTAGERAGRFAAVFAATNLTFAFYGRVSNLDVPYLFWTTLALDRLLDVAETRRASAHYAFGAFVALSVATKDQAYASYLLLAPVYLYVSLRGAGADERRIALVTIAKVALATLLVYGLASGALLNPTGFARRVAELRGPASQDWRMYSRDAAGFLANLRAVFERQPAYFWPLPVLALAYAGGVVTAFRPSAGAVPSRLVVHVPFLAGLGSLVFFALLVGRAEHRFLMPFGFFLSAYGGVACDALLAVASSPRLRQLLVALLGAGFGWAGLSSFAVHLTQLGDARWEVTRFLARLPAGSSVETYGLVVYQPHFDVSANAPYRVTRVGPEAPNARNPLVGASELRAAIADAPLRRPDALVLSEGFANAYLTRDEPRGAKASAVVRSRRGDAPTATFVTRAVVDDLAGYRQVLVARATLPAWARALGLRPVRIQSTTGSSLWVLARANATEVERTQ